MVGFNQIASFFGDPKTISFKSDKSDSPPWRFFRGTSRATAQFLGCKDLRNTTWKASMTDGHRHSHGIDKNHGTVVRRLSHRTERSTPRPHV